MSAGMAGVRRERVAAVLPQSERSAAGPFPGQRTPVTRHQGGSEGLVLALTRYSSAGPGQRVTRKKERTRNI
jgi:hypothetical protein